MASPGSSTPIIDKCAMVPVMVCAFAVIASPLLIYFTSPDVQTLQMLMEARPETRIFWPAMAALSIGLAGQHRNRLNKIAVPPHIICLLVYLVLAGASVLWAFSPDRSLVRFVQQAMIVTSIVLPAMLAARTADIMRGVFLCFAFAMVLNVIFVFGGSVTIASYNSKLVDIGYQGYFQGKNYLGECAAIAFLLSIPEMRRPGVGRRALGAVVFLIAILLVFMSDSKTALGLAFMSPLLAGLTLVIRKTTRISPAIILSSIPFFYNIVSHMSNFTMNRISYMLYGDSTFTGRTVIWDFVQYEIERRPFLGWGYQSFWLVPDSPSMVEAPGWVKTMPNAHNGYYDATLELGYVGFILLVFFIIATLHAVGRVADRDPARARLLLSLALFIIMYNYFESLWMRGFEFLWVVFLIVAAEIARYWQPVSLSRAVYRSRGSRPGSSAFSGNAEASVSH